MTLPALASRRWRNRPGYLGRIEHGRCQRPGLRKARNKQPSPARQRHGPLCPACGYRARKRHVCRLEPGRQGRLGLAHRRCRHRTRERAPFLDRETSGRRQETQAPGHRRAGAPRARSRIGSCRGDEVAAQWPLRGYEGRARGSSRNLCRTCRIPFCRNLERRPTHCAHPARRGIGQTSPGGIESPKE